MGKKLLMAEGSKVEKDSEVVLEVDAEVLEVVQKVDVAELEMVLEADVEMT